MKRLDHFAVIAHDQTLTYRELYLRSMHVGQLLRENGVVVNNLVAVVMEKGWEQVVAVLGILMSGAAYLQWEKTRCFFGKKKEAIMRFPAVREEIQAV